MRDYGRHDFTQLRFMAGRLLDEDFYIRGHITRKYFFRTRCILYWRPKFQLTQKKD